VKAAQNMFGKWAKGDKGAIFPDLRGAVFAIAIKHGGKEEVNRFKV
jgi:aminopeptidase 2